MSKNQHIIFIDGHTYKTIYSKSKTCKACGFVNNCMKVMRKSGVVMSCLGHNNDDGRDRVWKKEE